MEAKAVTRFVRISPRKLRLVIDLVRHKPLGAAFDILANLKKKGAPLVAKTLKSAGANAKVKKMDEGRLYVREIRADGGPMLKRFRARAMGRAFTILKRTSHLSVVLGERSVEVMPGRQTPQKGGEAASMKTLRGKDKKQLTGVEA